MEIPETDRTTGDASQGEDGRGDSSTTEESDHVQISEEDEMDDSDDGGFI